MQGRWRWESKSRTVSWIKYKIHKSKLPEYSWFTWHLSFFIVKEFEVIINYIILFRFDRFSFIYVFLFLSITHFWSYHSHLLTLSLAIFLYLRVLFQIRLDTAGTDNVFIFYLYIHWLNLRKGWQLAVVAVALVKGYMVHDSELITTPPSGWLSIWRHWTDFFTLITATTSPNCITVMYFITTASQPCISDVMELDLAKQPAWYFL